MADGTNVLSLQEGVATLATCIVQTINETDSTFQGRFIEKLRRAYSERKDHGADMPELELIQWVQRMLTGWSQVSGQGSPFLDGK